MDKRAFLTASIDYLQDFDRLVAHKPGIDMEVYMEFPILGGSFYVSCLLSTIGGWGGIRTLGFFRL
jgi:hypothetical protein